MDTPMYYKCPDCGFVFKGYARKDPIFELCPCDSVPMKIISERTYLKKIKEQRREREKESD